MVRMINMTYVTMTRVPHTGIVFRLGVIFKRKCDAEFSKEMLDLISPFNFIRYTQRF